MATSEYGIINSNSGQLLYIGPATLTRTVATAPSRSRYAQYDYMSCILTIRGQNLSVNTFIQESKLEPYKTFHKGEPRFRSKPDGEKHSYSGLSIETSKADFDKLQEQVQDTITFLETNKDRLQLISRTREVEHAVLDFDIELRIDEERVVFQFERFPCKLLKLAGELGLDIEISLYPKANEDG